MTTERAAEIQARIQEVGSTAVWNERLRIKGLKIGFGMERMTCGQFATNALFFLIRVLANNLFIRFKNSMPSPSGTAIRSRPCRGGSIKRSGGSCAMPGNFT